MRAVLTFIAVAALLLATMQFAQAYDYHGKQWQEKTAAEKLAILSKPLSTNQKNAGYPSTAESALLFVEGMPISFDTTADDMPKEVLGLITRRKLLHAVGLMATAKYTVVPNQYNYSGIFASGHPNVLLRFSSGNQPTTTGNTSDMIAAVALKFVRNGVSSANIHTLSGGASSFNFFAHDFSNHVPDFPFDAPLPALTIRALFTTASYYPTWLGLNKVAEYDVNGKKPSGPASFPWRIILHPTAALHGAFPDGNPGVLWYKQLAQGVKPGPLFSVYAIDSPFNDGNLNAAVLIGQITLTSPLTESYFGDRTLFYQHISLESDLSLISSWKQPAEQLLFWQRNRTAPYVYPDLPWK